SRAAWRRRRPGRPPSRCRARAGAPHSPPRARSRARSRSTGCGRGPWILRARVSGSTPYCWAPYLVFRPAPEISVFLDADDLRRARNDTLFPDGLQGAAYRILAGRVSDEDDRRGRGGAFRVVAAARLRIMMPLHDRLERDVLVGEKLGDHREGAGT